MNFFLPKQPAFSKYFKELSEFTKQIADQFGEFTQNLKDFEEHSKKAKDIEEKADHVTHQIIIALNKTFITPFDREDIYTLAHEMDDLVDLIDNAIHYMDIYQLSEKKYYIEEFGELIKKAAYCLDELIEECFLKEKYTDKVNTLIVEIHQIEDEADKIFHAALKKLFQEEKDPINVIKWKDIIEDLESIADKFQQVSNTIEGIIVKSS